jgi:hypothetical protein
MTAATAEITHENGSLSKVVDRPARIGSIWQDQWLVAWYVTGSEPVVVEGVRLGHRVTSRHATVDELQSEVAGLRRVLAAIHEASDV